jgi:AmmeMemoRadiSam system radical SAM enzyme
MPDREWVSITNPDDPHDTYLFDVSFLLSAYTCIYGRGCPGIGAEPDPVRACCVLGAHYVDDEDRRRIEGMVDRLGPDVPLHFTAFHPDYKLLDRPPTPPETLTRARTIARANGVRYAYTGNVHDTDGGSTFCHRCNARVVERDWYQLGEYALTASGSCAACGTQIPGVFAGRPGDWGPRRVPVRLATAPAR